MESGGSLLAVNRAIRESEVYAIKEFPITIALKLNTRTLSGMI